MTLDPSIELRPALADEMLTLITTGERAFGSDVKPERAALEMAAIEPERTLAAFDGRSLVASAGIYTFDMTIPGGPVPMAGVTWVGVLPTHRRRGILTAMMRRQLTELHEQEREPVAALWASEPVIYRRFGYGLGSMRLGMTVESRLPFVAGAPARGGVRLVDLAEARAVIQPIYDRIRVDRPGMVSRTPPRWDLTLDDAEDSRQGASSLQCAVTNDDGGYVLYRTKGDSQNWVPSGKVTVRDFVSTSPDTATLWRYLLDLDLMTTVESWNRPLDDPLAYLVTDVRRTRPAIGDAVWVRVVDVERGLAARTYSEAGSVVIEVVDETCPWNAGTFRIDVDAADSRGVKVARTEESAQLTVSAVELGAVYLGGTRLRALAAAGFVDEHTAGAVTRADRMFAGPVEPWCAEVF
ncbi:MAG: hypothetical protein QOG49_1173 [Frankiaceae bacterium]|nr:hypothetical protein [Frankiaceae bacterium]